MSRKFAREKLDKIQMDYGILYVNHGEASQRLVGPTRGGVTVQVMKELRDIEFDGRIGKTKDLQVIDAIDAKVTLNNLTVSRQDVLDYMPWIQETGTDPDFVQEVTDVSIGVVESDNYFVNITVFGKQVGGGYKKVTLINAMNEADFSMLLAQKGEAEIALEIFAHWDVDDSTPAEKLITIEDVASIA